MSSALGKELQSSAFQQEMELLDALEGRLDAIMAKHHQVLLDKLLTSLRNALHEAPRAHSASPNSKRQSLQSTKERPKKKSAASQMSMASMDHSDIFGKPDSSSRAVESLGGPEGTSGEENTEKLAKMSPKGRVMKNGVPSLVALESAMLHGFGPVNAVSSKKSGRRPSCSASPILIDRAAVPQRPLQDLQEVSSPVPPAHVPEPLDGVLPTTVEMPGPVTSTVFGVPHDSSVNVRATKIGVLMKDSQSAILQEIKDNSLSQDSKWYDNGSDLLMKIPRIVPTALGVGSILTVLCMIGISLWEGHNSIHSELFVIFTTGIFGFLGSACVRCMRTAFSSEDFHLAVSRLDLFVADFRLDWKTLSGQEWRLYLIAWLLLLSTQIASQGLQWWLLDHGHLDDADMTLQIVKDTVFKTLGCFAVLSFAVGSAIIMVTTFVLSHLLLGLDTALDCWCCHILNTPNFEFGVQSWNNLQALLKCVGRELDTTFVLIQGLSSLGAMYLLTSGVTYVFRAGNLDVFPTLAEGLAALPLLFLFGLSMRLFAHGAALTEKCKFIPGFVNQIPTEEPIDLDKQFLVNFVLNSNAGFYVRGVRLSQEMFVKQGVLVCGLLSGLFGALSRVYI